MALTERNYASTNTSFDIARKAQFFTLDVITDLAFGEPFGDLATDSDVHNWIHELEKNLPILVQATNLPWVMGLMRHWPFRMLIPSEADNVGLGMGLRWGEGAWRGPGRTAPETC
jgi:hypothetical protein